MPGPMYYVDWEGLAQSWQHTADMNRMYENQMRISSLATETY